MMSKEERINSILAQVNHGIKQNENELIDEILPDSLINSQISSNNYLKAHEPQLIGCTPLHLALKHNRIEVFDHLLSRGADFTIKNVDGSTVLHEAIKFIYEDSNDSVCGLPFFNSILSAYQSYENDDDIKIKDVNVCDNNGISHFHIACMRGNVKVVNFFLDHGVPINQVVNINSPHFPGYTPLHFAERYFAFATVKLLLQRGADVNLKDARGMTPLHTFLEHHLKVCELLHFSEEIPPNEVVEKVDEGVELNLMMMVQKYKKDDDINIVDDIDLSYLHVVCTMRSETWDRKFLKSGIDVNQPIKSDSPIWPGCTALHFAVQSYNVDAVKLLIEKKATLPEKFLFDCIEKYTIEDVHSIMSTDPDWKNILFSDDETKLLDLILAMRNLESFHLFLDKMKDVNVYIRNDSTLWPGFTPLHLAVLFTVRFIDKAKGDRREDDETLDLGLVQELLNRDADVSARRLHGYTPLRDAFELQKLRVVHLLLKHHNLPANLYGIDQLCHLHIACAAKDKDAVEKLLKNHANPNLPVKRLQFKWYRTVNEAIVYHGQECMFDIRPGSTPLHVAVASGSYEIVKMLLSHNANPHAKDSKGFTPLHCLLSHFNNIGSERIAKLLLVNYKNKQDCLTSINCSSLHVISSLRNIVRINCAIYAKFIAGSSNINTVIGGNNTAGSSWLGFFPLINKLLTYAEKDKEDETDDIQIKYILDHYRGYTPLHLVIENHSVQVAKVLIENNADIFAKKPNGSTPFYELLLSGYGDDNYSCLQYIIEKMKKDAVTYGKIKEWVKEDSGLTMLHIAMYIRDVNMVKDLLDNGADVNAKTHTNSPIWPGFTPLHVLLQTSATVSPRNESDQKATDEILELLLENRVDVTVENAKCESCIHLLDYLCNEDWNFDRLRKLMGFVKTFTMNPVNDQGITLFHLACKYNETNIVEGYLKEDTKYVNLRVEYFNDDFGGCTPLLFTLANDWTRWCTGDSRFATIDLLLENEAEICSLDDYRNNAIHCAVSNKKRAPTAEEYAFLIEKLVQKGCNINHQNSQGKTPLHVATENENYVAVSELLTAGADLNILDQTHRPAFAYVRILRKSRDSRKNMITIYISHLRKLEANGSVINSINERIKKEILQELSDNRIDHHE